jgi:hypothetical protein
MFYVPLRKEVRGEPSLLFPPPNFSILLFEPESIRRFRLAAEGAVLTVSAAELFSARPV